jgi:hypothetical protein
MRRRRKKKQKRKKRWNHHQICISFGMTLNFKTFDIFKKKILHSSTFLNLKQVVSDLLSLLILIHLYLLSHLLDFISLLEATWHPTNCGSLSMLFPFLDLKILYQSIQKSSCPSLIPTVIYYLKTISIKVDSL